MLFLGYALYHSDYRLWLKASYQSVPPGRPVAVPGSSGFLEIAINGGSARKLLGVKIGSRILCRTNAEGTENAETRRV